MKIKNGFFLAIFFLFSLSCTTTKGEVPQSRLEGHWEAMKYTTDTTVPYSTFQLDLHVSGKRIVGKYCFVTQSGRKIDCDPDGEDNISGEISNANSAVATLKFKSFFGARGGEANIYFEDDSLQWQVQILPTGGQFYGPKSSTLHKTSNVKR